MKTNTQENIETKIALKKRLDITHVALSVLGGGLIGLGIVDATPEYYRHQQETNQLTEMYEPRSVPAFMKETITQPDYTNAMNQAAAGVVLAGLGFATGRKISRLEDELKDLENQPYKHI